MKITKRQVARARLSRVKLLKHLLRKRTRGRAQKVTCDVHERNRLRKRNIVGFGIGHKITKGERTGVLAVQVFVSKKKPLKKLTRGQRIPSKIGNVPTDVIELGEFRFLAAAPVCGGQHVGRKDSPGAGTAACLVERTAAAANERPFLLSNWHVLAMPTGAAARDLIVRHETSGNKTEIAELSDFERPRSGFPNYFDAAIAQLLPGKKFSSDVLEIGPAALPALSPAVDMRVKKFGAKTQLTRGRIASIEGEIEHTGAGLVFLDQILIEGDGGAVFSKPGDSGSLVVEENTNRPVGLVSLTEGTYTAVCPIGAVLKRFMVRIL